MNIRKSLRPIILVFFAVALLTGVLVDLLSKRGIDPEVIFFGNLFLFILTVFSFWVLNRGLRSATTLGFTSSVYGSFLAKLVFSATAVVLYSWQKGDQKNMPALFVCMFLYLIYSFFEVKGLMALLLKKK